MPGYDLQSYPLAGARQDGEGPISVSLNGASHRREFPDKLALGQRWRERGRRDTTSYGNPTRIDAGVMLHQEIPDEVSRF
jgi:hypothetical protein